MSSDSNLQTTSESSKQKEGFVVSYRFSRGYIAITTTIILALVMLVLAITLGVTNLTTRLGEVDFMNKRLSYFTAQACLEDARLKLAIDSNYAGNEVVNVGSYQCSILDVETSGSNRILKARAQIQGPTTNLRLTVDSSTLETVTLEELSKF